MTAASVPVIHWWHFPGRREDLERPTFAFDDVDDRETFDDQRNRMRDLLIDAPAEGDATTLVN